MLDKNYVLTSLLPMSNYKRELAKVYEVHANKN